MLLNKASQTKSKLYSWGHWFSVSNMLFGFIVATIYWFAEPFPASILSQIYLVGYTIGHIAFLFFIGYLIFVFPVTLINKPNLARPWAAFVAALGLILLFIDALVYSVYGYHLNLLSLDYIQNDFGLLTQNLPAGFKAAILVLFIATFAIELVLANALWRNIEKFRRFFINLRVIPFVLVCFIGGHLGHIWADLNLYTQITKQDNMLPLSQPMTAKTILSQSGLVDLDEYKQKKELTFDVSSHLIAQPKYQFSCLAPLSNLNIKVLSTQADNIEQLVIAKRSAEPGIAVAKHWSPVSVDNALFELLTGVPAIYQQKVGHINGILDSALITTNTSLRLSPMDLANKLNLSEFAAQKRISDDNLSFEFKQLDNLTEATRWLTYANYDNQIVIILANDRQAYGRIMVKGELVSLPDLTSNFDILPTILEGWLACSFYADYQKFGHNLFSVPVGAAWLVTADKNNIYVWSNNTNTRIQGDGQMQSYSLQTGELVDAPATSTLIRAINHLKRNLVDK
ncbi:DUF3413 domain-containing protein [Catenovulum sp. 2E275]|uniref:DUF3413 domain-containing protein n=1 Tax=Catenovulum sp. 2E275 TaxID=2980497 RepID=UPI0021CFBAED|nr:DUF3413 domain-containing protein [Catenovulum sp. 2E275]MCU4674503.1 DUF3413 domain-containing protein [Catenovulum sp. 2E275]